MRQPMPSALPLPDSSGDGPSALAHHGCWVSRLGSFARPVSAPLPVPAAEE
jgi:hypothetical protein